MSEDILVVFKEELGLIKDDVIRSNVERIFKAYEEQLLVQPSSLSGKYHEQDRDIITHLKRTVWFAHELAREFKITGDDYNILIAASLMHDIGMLDITMQGVVDSPDWKYYKETDFSRKLNGSFELHPIYGSIIVGQKPFKHSRRIQDLIEVHMSHWQADRCPLPENLLEYCICISDYFASRNIVVNDTRYC